MAEIKKLSPAVAALIAAGEVVERPASVIKELVENSIDALASHITVELRRGGITYMRVTDNGKGMAEEDVPTAFLRHATSKIESGEDLESIVTLGFRGEALYSIAAVANVEIITKRREDNWGVSASVSGGSVPDVQPTGCPDGTSVIVRDLFFNTPARIKFLKKDSVEAGYAEDIVRKIALARPDISFRFISNGKEIFFTPGDSKLENAVAALFGRDFAGAMLPVDYAQDGVRITGLVGKSELTRPNRTFQIFFVNGRCVMHKSFYVALGEAYKGQIMAGRFPVCVLHLNVDPELCDVNVHPAKAEIKFANDKPVFDVIYWGAKNSLYAIRDTRTLQLEKTPPKPAEDSITGEQTKLIPPTEPPVSKVAESATFASRHVEKKPENTFAYPQTTPPKEKNDIPVAAAPVRKSILPDEIPAPHKQEAVKPEPAIEVAPEEKTETPPPPFVRVLGQAFDTYIIAESEGKLLLVDQHAAHERILFNSLMEGFHGRGIDCQLLLMPVSVQLSPSEMSVFEENVDILLKSGFDAEEFGSGIVKISTVPTALTGCDVSAAFLEVIDRLATKRDLKTEAETNALHSIACKAAMKAGKQLSIKEQEDLVQKALQLDGIATCPHGRPVILSLTQKEIEKQFKRIV
ncbi:MAG: DNA mismatch repair endonuclease MutL [Ruminococcaceae bacterium]|nr:DNA mismatch repair endonuclease MutL [Oscillospiraceae bacterium]